MPADDIYSVPAELILISSDQLMINCYSIGCSCSIIILGGISENEGSCWSNTSGCPCGQMTECKLRINKCTSGFNYSDYTVPWWQHDYNTFSRVR